MCYFSAESVKNRKARLHETVPVGRLNDHAIGLVCPDDPEMAVCLEPGTTLIIEGIPATRQKQWGVGHEAAAVFKTFKVGKTGTIDALAFNNHPEQSIDFQTCVIGMKFFIDSIPAEAASEPEGALPTERQPEYA